MVDNVTARVRVPREASAGEVVSIRTLINHPMESGQRRDDAGEIIPRSIIHRFTCDFNGTNVIDVTLEPSISTNPYLQFEAVVQESGTFQFTWYDDDGSVYEESADIAVS
ncbi:MAG: thiosulfate oxidation carrier complex protein SoxZ [Rhodobacteraceae bacterium]|jgi:sulfur-oxidizing protein SoxZ|nr:thiosulfate oxidation carrier complex protein SoxZ [Paracoccaceae bacterium]